ncbi:MAG: hypothetical protein ABEI11_01415 [Haloarculaceae archaeon]
MSLRDPRDGGDGGDGRGRPGDRLTATHVAYDDRPDRLTLHPAEADDVERMSTWLTADADVFVDLAGVR